MESRNPLLEDKLIWCGTKQLCVIPVEYGVISASEKNRNEADSDSSRTHNPICAVFETLVLPQNYGNIFRVTVPLWREFTGHRWIPLTKASDVELWCFLWSVPEQTLSKQSKRWWYETSSRSLWRHCNGASIHQRLLYSAEPKSWRLMNIFCVYSEQHFFALSSHWTHF